jgi:lipoprotein-releasing system ATP-binding protein
VDSGREITIRTVGLTKRYGSGANEVLVFDDLNLEILSGERVALVGESGAGKSSLLHLLGGLDRPTKGRILFGARDISELGEAELADFRNREIGFVWQTHYLLPEFTALENVMMPLLIRGIAPEEAAKAALERLAEVGLATRVSHRAGELSGGEQQRVVLARALVGRPRVLLADEPTGNLDQATGQEVVDLLFELRERTGTTLLLVTHDHDLAARCGRLVRLADGRVAAT